MKVSPPFVRSPDNYDRDKASDDSGLRCLDASLTKQSFAEEADINTIVRRFNLTGELPSDVRAPTYADFEGVFDFHSAMNAVAAAGESFDRLPAALRARFHNNPAEFVDFCSDAANRAEAEKLGLVFEKELSSSGSSGRVDVGGVDDGELEQSGRVDPGAGDSSVSGQARKKPGSDGHAERAGGDARRDKGSARGKAEGK